MKKLLTISIIFLLSIIHSFGQGPVLRGHIVSMNRCQLEDTGGYKIISSERVYQTFISISQEKLYSTGSLHLNFDLVDKMVDSSDGSYIVSFYGLSRKNYYIIALRECEGYILVGVFPTDGKDKFTEYKVKLIERKNGRNKEKGN